MSKFKNLKELEEELADLEAKLAESEEKYKKAYREGLLQKQFDKDAEIMQLEQQLAESEKKRLMWQEMYKSADKQNKNICETDIYPLQEENQQLKQQLAEKNADLHQIYSHLGVEAFGEDIHEQALKEIGRLQEQLAEKDRIIESLKPIYESVVQTCHNDAKEIDRLNKVIAEKETDLALSRNEINTLKHNLNVSQEHYKVMCEKYFQKCQETNENKISFAVEKLEKVKDYFCEEDEDGDGIKTGDWTITKDACDVAEYIDNQIKELEIEKIVEFYINTEDKK